MNFYKHYIGDFQRDTRRLSLTERGAYRELLDALYADETPLPKDKRELYRIAGCENLMERKAVDKVIAEYFELTQDGYVQHRAMQEIERASKQRSINQELGRRGGRPKGSGKKTEQETETRTEQKTESVFKTEPNKNPNQTPDYSEAKASGVPPDPIFGDGVAYLVSTGDTERGARSFLGKMRQALGDDLVAAELLAEAQRKGVSDPKSWLRAAAQRRTASGRQGNGVAL